MPNGLPLPCLVGTRVETHLISDVTLPLLPYLLLRVGGYVDTGRLQFSFVLLFLYLPQIHTAAVLGSHCSVAALLSTCYDRQQVKEPPAIADAQTNRDVAAIAKLSAQRLLNGPWMWSLGGCGPGGCGPGGCGGWMWPVDMARV